MLQAADSIPRFAIKHIMIVPSNPHSSFTLALIEAGLTIFMITVAACWPRIGSRQFAQVESFLKGVARRKRLAIILPGLLVLILRLAILPVAPIPRPFSPDDFSFLLSSDTFAAGRLANPTPAMWTHFESIHITVFPTYASMYFPAQGLLLAAGKVLFGHPWFGLLIVDALMCSALCWMLQAWLPPTWAFLGAMLAVLRLGLFSYWINTYTGGGFCAALGGCLLLGAIPRIRKTGELGYGMLIAAGIVLLALSRPYEGLLLCLPVAFALGRWLLRGENKPTVPRLLRCAALPVALLVAAGSWMAYYDYRAFGNPLTLPYTVDRATYAVAPYYVWQSARPEPAYRHAVMREFYVREEMKYFRAIHTISGFVPRTLVKVFVALVFYGGFALLLPLVMVRRIMLDRRIRFILVCVGVLTGGMLIEIFLVPHYLAPFTAAFYVIGLQAMRHLRVWRRAGNAVGLALVRLTVVLCCFMAAVRISARPLHIAMPEWPAYNWLAMWYGPDQFGNERAKIEDSLQRSPGTHLVMVRYGVNHYFYDEWVYNGPNLDASRVIWAREMDAAENDRLIEYYTGRQVWLVQPDVAGGALQPYPAAAHASTGR